ncbi:MAG: hypothetical protein K0Q62_973 [Phenylobacterium sp.]|jgi:hypothetical protein|nr:hypothetical protein [Phenylobacterium sp.]
MAQDKDTQGEGDEDVARRNEQEELARKAKQAPDSPEEKELERARRESAAKRAE